ncbi:MAG TPA: hypothetical protein VJR47_03515 [Stellaceae bacterium]|nr:hypothetical protein [Stellaceae bacterium]
MAAPQSPWNSNAIARLRRGSGTEYAIELSLTKPGSRYSNVNENAPAFHHGFEDAETHHAIEPNRVSGLDVEAKEMPGADHSLALDLPEADRPGHMRAPILESGDLSVLPTRERDLGAILQSLAEGAACRDLLDRTHILPADVFCLRGHL